MYNLLVLFCLFLSIFLMLWSIEAFRKWITLRSDIKSDAYRSYCRRSPEKQEAYRKDYWIRNNREDMFEREVLNRVK